MRIFFPGVLCGLALLGGGCAAFIPVEPPPAPEPPPFTYEPLRVRNSCFVESVHFYDMYRSRRDKADDDWVRVLQWGNQDGDFTLSSGHAIAVFTEKGELWSYDVNFGFSKLEVPVEKRADLSEVTPVVFSRYPQYRPVFARYRDDFHQTAPEKVPGFLFYHANQDVRDATRVASELGRFRPVSVVEYKYERDGKPHRSAVTVFIFGGRVCIYLPDGGTQISNPLVRSVDNLRWVSYVINKIHPGAKDFRPQPGGYLVFPPKA